MENIAWDLSGTEQLTLCHDRASGLRAVIAIDDTTLGPGLGGVRWQRYRSEAAAIDEARRLSRVMTLKNACADLPYGGAKSVLLADGPGRADPENRQAQLRAFGRFIERLGGAYIPGVDMGTTTGDLATMGQVAHDVACDHEDPFPHTALGIFAGLRAAVADAGISGWEGVSVAIQGAGHVGADLAARLAAQGCTLTLADVDTGRAAAVARSVGARTVDPADITTVECDVFAPCATARVINRATVGALRCRIVAGGANDVLATHDVAAMLARRGITYVPDFVVNAGGVIQIHALRAGWDHDKLEGSLLAIGDRVARILRDARRNNQTPLSIAEEMASHRLGRPIALPA